jgi:phage-related protein
MIDLPRKVKFYQEGGREPVRDWLQELPPKERKIIGEDIKTVQWLRLWKMPLVESLGNGLWEVRSTLPNRIVRVLFCELQGNMILLHAFIKKTQKTPPNDLNLALGRKKRL